MILDYKYEYFATAVEHIPLKLEVNKILKK